MDPTACLNFIRNATDATPAQVRDSGGDLRLWLAKDGCPPMGWDRMRAYKIADRAAHVSCANGVDRLRRFIDRAARERQNELNAVSR